MMKVMRQDANAPTLTGSFAPMIQAPMYGTRK